MDAMSLIAFVAIQAAMVLGWVHVWDVYKDDGPTKEFKYIMFALVPVTIAVVWCDYIVIAKMSGI